MDAQELRNIQEAYLDVYSELDEGFKRFPSKRVANKIDKMHDDPNIDTVFGDDARRRSEMLRVYKDMKGETHPLIRAHSPKKSQQIERQNRNRPESEKRSKTVKPQKSFPNRLKRGDEQGIHDSYDYYDIILSHLLDEGYAETPEAAKVIMVNMSEEWKQSIVG